MRYSSRDPDVKWPWWWSVHSSPDDRIFCLRREENSGPHGFRGDSFVTDKWSPCLSDSDTTGDCWTRAIRGEFLIALSFSLPSTGHCASPGPRRIIAGIKASLGSALGSVFNLCLSHFSSSQGYFFYIHNGTKFQPSPKVIFRLNQHTACYS
jgi:hypothetical protein